MSRADVSPEAHPATPDLGGEHVVAPTGDANSPDQSLTASTRRVELILRQIDVLPTLPAIATRLLSLTANNESHAREVVELVRSDPALTAKILSICRHADVGIRSDTLTIDRAVMLMGFNAVRNAVLSIQVFALFNVSDDRKGSSGGFRHEGVGPDDEEQGQIDRFDRPGFWRHCMATAIAAEMIARNHPEMRDLNPDEAFVCGLLHDLGKLALERVLPKAYSRVLELVDLNQGVIAEFERRIIGVDHHTAGKRLAEQWQLPHQIQDCIWLHGCAYELLPDLHHKRMIGLTGLADLVVRRQHLGFSGNYIVQQDVSELAVKMGLDPDRVSSIVKQLHDEVEKRSKALGLDEQPSVELFVDSIQRANRMLGRLNASLERRARMVTRQVKVLEGIANFHRMQTPGSNVQDIMGQVAQSATTVLEEGYYALLAQSSPGQPWLLVQYSKNDSRVMHQEWIDPPHHGPDLSSLDASQPLAVNLMSIIPWVADYLMDAPDLRDIRLLPLPCGWGTAGVLLHDRPMLPDWQTLEPLVRTWGSAIAAANQHDGARRLGEQLAEANRALADAQDKLLQQDSLARVGEMAAGAAHEMNNPLTIISGRSQLLAAQLTPGSPHQQAAQAIVDQSHRLSDLITALRMYADPPTPRREQVNIGRMLDETLKQVYEVLPRNQRDRGVSLKLENNVTHVMIDGEQISQAVRELLLNAFQSNPKTGVVVRTRVEEADRALRISVSDDGCGMDERTLQHAMDPFFSAKPAGRQVGMGLPRAQQLVSGHGGKVDLRTTNGQGTTATLVIPLDSTP